jgi:hypothetical protein
MNNKVTPDPQNEIPPELDRRGANRAASQWVRTALNEQSEKIDKIGDEVHKINEILTKSIPNADWEYHHKSHIIFETREEERKRLDADNQKRIEENRQFWLSVKHDIIKWALRAAGLFLVGVLLLGFQTKFKEAVIAALADKPDTAIEVKK